MSNGIQLLSEARRKRLHRISAAQFLASIESSCSSEELSQITWQSLEAIPHWCLSERGFTNQLQLVCGTILLAPLIGQWLDGNRLKQARALLGNQYFDAAMSVGSEQIKINEYESTEPVPELLASAGAAVLVGSVPHVIIRKLLSRQFPLDLVEIDDNIAQNVYQQALAVIDQLSITEPGNIHTNTDHVRATEEHTEEAVGS